MFLIINKRFSYSSCLWGSDWSSFFSN